MDHVHVFVARAIALHIEGRNTVAKLVLEAILRAECEASDFGMKAVGPDHEVERLLPSALESNLNGVRAIVDRGDLVIENNFG
jgi:hypothetical protein